MRRPSRLHLAVVVSCLVVTAGCGGFADDSPETPQTVEDPQTTISATTDQTTTSTPSTTTTATTTISYTAGLEDELRIANLRNQTQTVAVNVTDGNGTVVFEKAVTVAPGGNVTFDFSYPGGGTYVATVVVGNESATRTYDVQSSDPGSRIGVVLLDDGTRIDEEAV